MACGNMAELGDSAFDNGLLVCMVVDPEAGSPQSPGADSDAGASLRHRRHRLLAGGLTLAGLVACGALAALVASSEAELEGPSSITAVRLLGAAVPRRLASSGNVQNVGVECKAAVPGDQCHEQVQWVMQHGIREHRDWYPARLTETSSFADFQLALHDDPVALCPRPCGAQEQTDPENSIVLQPSVGYDTSGRVVSQGMWCSAPEPAQGWALNGCPMDAAGAVATEVKILTYNLFWWNLFGVRQGNGGSAGRLIAEASAPAKFDVMGFQECEGIAKVMEDGGLIGEYGALVGPHAMCVAFRKARWTLLSDGAQDVGEDRNDQWYGTRAVMWIRLQNKVTNSTLLFVNHHGPLPVGTGGRCGGEATAYNVLKIIAREARIGDAVVLAGDFNAGPESQTLQHLDSRMNTVYSGSSFGGVDNVFSNCASVVGSRNLGSGGSDHDALEVTLRI